MECVIPQQYHRTVMGNRGTNVQEITRVHEVGIKFPDRAPQQNGGMFYLITNPMTFHNLG